MDSRQSECEAPNVAIDSLRSFEGRFFTPQQYVPPRARGLVQRNTQSAPKHHSDFIDSSPSTCSRTFPVADQKPIGAIYSASFSGPGPDKRAFGRLALQNTAARHCDGNG